MSDRYQIISAVGSSRAGTLHRGWDKHQNRDVSIQRIQVAGEAAAEVLREARALYGLRHPNVVTVYEYGSDAEGVYVVREMLKGKPLDAIVTQRPLSETEFEILVRQTLGALHEAHMCGLIHRNLQPGTLMVPWNAQNAFSIKITDFTLGAPLATVNPPTVEAEHFMAPEQFGNSPVTLRADLYSLGAIFYYCLTQQHPFKGTHSSEVVVAHLYHQCTPLQELRPDLSRPFCAWVERLMKPHAAERPASAEEALEMFKLIPEDDVIAAAPLVEEEEPAAIPIVEEETEEAPIMMASAEPEVAEQPELPRPPAPQPEAAVPMFSEPASPVKPAAAAAAPEALRNPAASMKEPPPRRSALTLIMIAFGAILLGMLILISVLKYTSKDEREQRLAELSQSDNPEGSDLDVRMLLDFLEERQHRDTAATALAKLQGGAYIDTMLTERLGGSGAHSAEIKLVEVIGQRGIRDAFEKVLPLTRDRSQDMRKAAWTALGRIADT
ncbi:MAG TPA: protein kinase, partial [Prosthecobacter sp.]|nr:protein kinase [Prosthecobacter sp.]